MPEQIRGSGVGMSIDWRVRLRENCYPAVMGGVFGKDFGVWSDGGREQTGGAN